MINLDIKSKAFKGNEKWPLLYVIAEIYTEFCSKDSPLLDNQVISIARDRFNLLIERHLVKRYRDYLTRYFGFSFKKNGKGHYLENDVALTSNVIKKNCPLGDIINYDVVTVNDTLTKKASLILSAIKNNKQIRFTVKNCICFVSDYLQAKKREYYGKPVAVKEGHLTVTPIKVFIHSTKMYLLSFNDVDSLFYINLLETMILRNDSITKIEAKKVSFDLDDYVSKQDFIVTGPVDTKHAFKYSFKCVPEPYGFSNIEVFYCKRKEKNPSFKYFLQTIIDLYGEKEVSIRFPQIDHFVKGKKIWDMVDSFAIKFPCDTRAETLLKRYSTDEIYFDDYYFDSLRYDYD